MTHTQQLLLAMNIAHRHDHNRSQQKTHLLYATIKMRIFLFCGLTLSILTPISEGFSVHSALTRRTLTNNPSTTQLAAATALPLAVESTPTLAAKEDDKVGVLFLNLGGPEKSEDVEGGCLVS
jgi:hypothetical protein